MRAVAVGLLGYGPGAEDAVQDGMLTALHRLDDLREPAAVGPWLRAVVRNVCRMQLRAGRPTAPLDEVAERWVAAGAAAVEESLDRHALRDWVCHAVGQLSEPLQLVVLLRHFGRRHSYAEIAEVCGIPIGTVRSRLNEARRRLAGALVAQAEAAHPDVGVLERRRCAVLRHMLAASGDRGDLTAVVEDLAAPSMTMAGWWGTASDGRDLLVHILSSDSEAGVRERVVDVAASTDWTVVECELISPPWDPTHCPPGVLWLIHVSDDRIDGIRLHHPVPA
jgi:RNA polymerase sigma-70 factor (ECF subfamily)